MTDDDIAAVQAAFGDHLRAEARTRDDGTATAIENVADDVEHLPLDNEQLRRLTALCTRPGPDGLDAFVLGAGWSRWIGHFDPRAQALEQLLDVIIRDDTDAERREVDQL